VRFFVRYHLSLLSAAAHNWCKFSFTTLAPADYMFQVTDANGCTYQELYTIVDVIELLVLQQLERLM
jgi:hypothetical protein